VLKYKLVQIIFFASIVYNICLGKYFGSEGVNKEDGARSVGLTLIVDRRQFAWYAYLLKEQSRYGYVGWLLRRLAAFTSPGGEQLNKAAVRVERFLGEQQE